MTTRNTMQFTALDTTDNNTPLTLSFLYNPDQPNTNELYINEGSNPDTSTTLHLTGLTPSKLQSFRTLFNEAFTQMERAASPTMKIPKPTTLPIKGIPNPYAHRISCLTKANRRPFRATTRLYFREIIEAREAGKTLCDIAAEFPVSLSTVQRVCAKLKLTRNTSAPLSTQQGKVRVRRGYPFGPETRAHLDKITSLRRGGMKMVDIAKEVPLCYRTVQRVCRRLKIKPVLIDQSIV